jgi:hypothetical protein
MHAVVVMAALCDEHYDRHLGVKMEIGAPLAFPSDFIPSLGVAILRCGACKHHVRRYCCSLSELASMGGLM